MNIKGSMDSFMDNIDCARASLTDQRPVLVLCSQFAVICVKESFRSIGYKY